MSQLPSDEFIEDQYKMLPTSIRDKVEKEKLIIRLQHINWNISIGRRGPLCLRNCLCSPDCHGSDCDWKK